MSGFRMSSGPKPPGDDGRQKIPGEVLSEGANKDGKTPKAIVDKVEDAQQRVPGEAQTEVTDADGKIPVIDNDPTRLFRIDAQPEASVKPEPSVVVNEELLNQPDPKMVEMFTRNDLTFLAHIGRGGMGSVTKAMHDNLLIEVAVKTMSNDFLNDEGVRKRFKTEAQAIAKLEHPNIVRIVDLKRDKESNVDLIIMEYINGQDMLGILNSEGPMKWNRLRELFIQVCDAFQAVHNMGILHRDIKPDNILVKTEIQKNGSDHIVERVKIVDFGLAKITNKTNSTPSAYQTVEGAFMGSPEWASPEQVVMKGVDHRSDIYSVGAVMYNMITGMPPYFTTDDKSPQERLWTLAPKIRDPKDIPKSPHELAPDRATLEVSEIIMRCIAKNPDDRYQSMEELKNAIIGARPHTPLPIRLVQSNGTAQNPTNHVSETLTPHSVPPLDSEKTQVVKIPQPLDIARSAKTIIREKPGKLSLTRKRLGYGVIIGASIIGALGLTYVATRPKVEATSNIERGQPLVENVTAPVPTNQLPQQQPDSGSVQPIPPVQTVTHMITFRTNVDGVEVLRGEDSICSTSSRRCSTDIAEGSEGIVFTFRKNGFRDREMTIVPDTDRSVDVRMEPQRTRPTGSGTQQHRPPQDDPWQRMVPNYKKSN